MISIQVALQDVSIHHDLAASQSSRAFDTSGSPILKSVCRVLGSTCDKKESSVSNWPDTTTVTILSQLIHRRPHVQVMPVLSTPKEKVCPPTTLCLGQSMLCVPAFGHQMRDWLSEAQLQASTEITRGFIPGVHAIFSEVQCNAASADGFAARSSSRSCQQWRLSASPSPC